MSPQQDTTDFNLNFNFVEQDKPILNSYRVSQFQAKNIEEDYSQSDANRFYKRKHITSPMNMNGDLHAMTHVADVLNKSTDSRHLSHINSLNQQPFKNESETDRFSDNHMIMGPKAKPLKNGASLF